SKRSEVDGSKTTGNLDDLVARSNGHAAEQIERQRPPEVAPAHSHHRAVELILRLEPIEHRAELARERTSQTLDVGNEVKRFGQIQVAHTNQTGQLPCGVAANVDDPRNARSP